MSRDAATLSDARREAVAFVGKPITNLSTGVAATVSNNTLGKMASESAAGKSTRAADHSLAIANADQLFQHALLNESHADRKGEPTIAAIERYVAPMLTPDGRVVAVKMTVNRTTSEKTPNPLYSIESLEIESPPSVLSRANPDATGIRPQAGLSESVRRLIAAVNGEGVSNVVDPDTGEPLVVYHGTATPGLKSFDFSNGGLSAGWFTTDIEEAKEYARNGGASGGIVAAYLRIERPVSQRALFDAAEQSGINLDDGDALERFARARWDGIRLQKRGMTVLHFVPFSATQIKSDTGNSGNFDGADARIDHFAAKRRQAVGTPTDRAVMDMAREGQPVQGILRLIADTSKSRFNRQVARLLLKTGITPEVVFADTDLGGGDGFKFKAKYSRAQDRVTLTGEAAGQAEQIVLHELIHAATLKALDKPGLHSLQMRRLFEHVKRQGGAAGQYGMKNVGEFVAEVFTNPEFQRLLRQMDAPAGGSLKSAWEGFVRILRSILGLPQDGHDALSRALEVGVAVMREDMGLRQRGVRGVGGDAHFGAAELGRIKSSALDQINAVMSHPGKVSLWDKSVGTMRNLAERAPAFKPVYEAAQRFIDDVATMANDAADMAPRVLPRVDSWRDLAKKPISAADNKAVAKPLFEGTLLWARDANDKPVLVSDLEKRCEGKTDRSLKAARELKKNWPEGQQRTEQTVNSPHPLTPEKGVNPAADFPDARPADGSLGATVCTPDYGRLMLPNRWRTRPNLAFICVNDTSTSASCRACKRSNVRRCMPFGLGPLPFKIPGSQPSRSRSLSACRVARSSRVSRSHR